MFNTGTYEDRVSAAQDTTDRVIAIVETLKRLVVEIASITEKVDFLPSTMLNEIIARHDLDSLDQMELIMAIEDEFDVQIADENAERWVTISDIILEIFTLKNYKPYSRPAPQTVTPTQLTQLTQPTIKDYIMSDKTNRTGKLILPTDDRDDFIFIEDISEEQALAFVNAETKRILGSKKVVWHDKDAHAEYKAGNEVDHMTFTKFPSVDEDDFLDTFEESELEYSNTPKIRGTRAVYLNAETRTIGIGTTVIYNKNWATIAYDSPEVQAELLDFLTNYA